MTKFEKWCEKYIACFQPIDLKRKIICKSVSCCEDCPLSDFEDCENFKDPNLIKWFTEEIKND